MYDLVFFFLVFFLLSPFIVAIVVIGGSNDDGNGGGGGGVDDDGDKDDSIGRVFGYMCCSVILFSIQVNCYGTTNVECIFCVEYVCMNDLE